MMSNQYEVMVTHRTWNRAAARRAFSHREAPQRDGIADGIRRHNRPISARIASFKGRISRAHALIILPRVIRRKRFSHPGSTGSDESIAVVCPDLIAAVSIVEPELSL
jgi:hypothetical protein